MRRIAALLLGAVSVLVTASMSAATTCEQVNGPGPLQTHYECIESGPTASSNFTYYAPNQDSMCSLYPSGGLYKSLGSYGSGYGHWSIISPDSPFAYFSVKVVLDLNNTHSHDGNRVAVLVYDDDSYTVETLGTIDGSGGDICSGTYTFNVYRPGWVSKPMRLSIQSNFQDNDANSKVGYVSMTVFDQQAW